MQKGKVKMATKGKVTPKVCPICGKHTMGGVMGNLCTARQKAGQDKATMLAAYKKVQLAAPPANWVKIAQIDRACKANHIPISRLVKAFGGDTPLGVPNTTTPIMGVVYVGRARYAHSFWATKAGLACISNGGGKIPTAAMPQSAPRPSLNTPAPTPDTQGDTAAK